MLSNLQDQIAELESKLAAHVDSNKTLRRQVELLTSIQGIGLSSAYRILSYLPDLNGFLNAKQLAAYIGLTPCHNQSGTYAGETPLSCRGHSGLRKVLYMPALSLKRGCALAPFVHRLEKNGLSKKAVVGALMRKLAHIIFGVLKHQRPFDKTLACAR